MMIDSERLKHTRNQNNSAKCKRGIRYSLKRLQLLCNKALPVISQNIVDTSFSKLFVFRKLFIFLSLSLELVLYERLLLVDFRNWNAVSFLDEKICIENCSSLSDSCPSTNSGCNPLQNAESFKDFKYVPCMLFPGWFLKAQIQSCSFSCWLLVNLDRF